MHDLWSKNTFTSLWKVSHASNLTSRLYQKTKFIYNSIQLAHSHCCPYSCPEPDPWVQWASELGLVPVDEISLVVCDAVKGQNPCMLVQIDANPSGLRWAQQFFLAIVPEGETGLGPVQAPGQSIVAQTAFVIRTLTFHLLVGHADGDLHGGTGKNVIKKRKQILVAANFYLL